ncbi:MAG: AmmeMemoRadiSam system radical SAM enzyme [Lentisphaeria bacterium]|nr:AmmeMemoRadiSam system radical SAM enzyme [Lentisphaeria bacterium]
MENAEYPAASPARWWEAEQDGSVRCGLCPRACRIPAGGAGYCGVRINRGGRLFSLAYGHPVSVAVDPIEKKPLNHFLPGTKVLSLGTFGCNLGCVFCQNHTLSRACYPSSRQRPAVSPEEIVRLTKREKCPSLAFTYNEPTVFAEYAADIARLARQEGIKTVLVSNGMISAAPADELYPLIDAANIDMKGFSEAFYAEMCGGSLHAVLDSLLKLKKLGVHLEVTTLVIPGKNDSDEMTNSWLDWVENNLGRETVLHFSAYFPAFRCRIPATPAETLYRIRDLCRLRGFCNIYLGNI